MNEWYDQEVQYDEDAPFLTDLSEKEQRKYIDEAKETLQAEFPRGTFFVGRSLIPKSQADKYVPFSSILFLSLFFTREIKSNGYYSGLMGLISLSLPKA